MSSPIDEPVVEEIEGTQLQPAPQAPSSRRQTLFATALFAVLCTLLNLRVLLGAGVPIHGDITFPLHLDNYVNNYRYLFTDAGSTPNLESVDRVLVLFPLSMLAKVLGFGAGFIYKVLFFALPLISLLSAFFLLRYILVRLYGKVPGSPSLICGAILYGFSPWVMEQLQAYLYWLAYALTPALVLLVFRFLEGPRWSTATGLVVVLSCIAVTPQYLAYSTLIVLLIALLSSWMKRRLPREESIETRRRRRRGLIDWSAYVVLGFLALNAYWLLPILRILIEGQAIDPGYHLTRSSVEMFSTNSSLINVFRGFDQWVIWYAQDSRLGFVFNTFWVMNSIAIPFLALGALVREWSKRSIEIRVLMLVGGLFILLSMGTNTPIYEWLAFEAPILSGFGWVLRVPGKLSYFPWLAYAVGSALLVEGIRSSSLSPRLRFVATAVFLISLTALLAPKAIIYFYDYYAPVQVPRAYTDLYSYLEKNAGDDRTVFMAPYAEAFNRNSLEYETSFTWNPRRLATATPVLSSPTPSVGYYHLTYRDWQTTLFGQLEPDIPPSVGRRLLAPAGIKYLVYHRDIVNGDAEAESDLAALRDSDLLPVASFGDSITLWETPTEPRLFSDTRVSEGMKLTVHRVTPSRYELTSASDLPTSIYMGQPFDPLWRARSGSRLIQPRETKLGYMVFNLPPDQENVSIEYVPQNSFDQGLLISGLGLVLLVVPIMFLRLYRSRKV